MTEISGLLQLPYQGVMKRVIKNLLDFQVLPQLPCKLPWVFSEKNYQL